jgi:paraquat-inducible protein B
MRANATIIGAFVLGAIVLLVAGILFFGSGTLLQKRIPIVSFFHGSVAGLQVGAPVTFRGVPVGEVKAIGIRIDPTTRALIIQVDMRVWPDKVAVYGPRTPDDKLIPTLVAQGVAAQLARQSFVTGLLNVDLDFRPGVHYFGLAKKTEWPRCRPFRTNTTP